MAADGADASTDKIWRELRKLRDIPPPLGDEGNEDGTSASYSDFAASTACSEVRATIGRCSELPRDEFLGIFTRLVEGPQLEELIALFKLSRSPPHPALQYTCLVVLHGVAELDDRRKDLLTHPDFIREICAVMASPRQRLVTPSSTDVGERKIVNAADAAITTITGLFTSNGTLEPEYAKLWVELGVVSALSSCLESHAEFDLSLPVSADLPLCFFLIVTSLLAGAAERVSGEDMLRLAEAWLSIFVEATRWVAHESADLLADLFFRRSWLGHTVPRIPEALRAQAVQVARTCELEGRGRGNSWKRGKSERLALALRCGNMYAWGEGGKPEARECAGPGCERVQRFGYAASGSSAFDTPVGGAGASAGAGAGGGDGDGDGGEGGGAFKRCSQCRAVSYCSRDCQKAGWKGHRKACTGSHSLQR